LTVKSVEKGKISVSSVPVMEIRSRAQNNLAEFPDEYRRLRYPQTYDVLLSPKAAQIKQALLEAANFYRTETAAGKES
jgi:hypothetical protein